MSIFDTAAKKLQTGVQTVSNSPLMQFIQYNSQPNIIAEKERYLQSTCPNYNQWKSITNTLFYGYKKDYLNLQLSPHYKVSDYVKGSRSKQFVVCLKTVQIMETMWNYFGKAVVNSCGYRDPAYNSSLSGAAKGSMHLWGCAVDFEIAGLSAPVIGEFIHTYFPNDCQIGVYGTSDTSRAGNWVHVAPRGSESIYYSRGAKSITTNQAFRQYKSANSPDEPIIFSDSSYSGDYAYSGDGTSSSSLYGSGFGMQSVNIDYTKLNPYILTIDRTVDDVDMDLMKENGVVGYLIEGGYLFTSNHVKVNYFRNPRLVEQMEWMDKDKTPFGFYMIARAKNEDEVDEEMYEFSFLIRKYPPMFGAWLVLELPNTKEVNNRLIQRYYKALVRLGLKQKIGFYNTKEQLDKQIDWEKFQNDWFLWAVKPVDNMSEIDKLLDPEFFDMDGNNPPADWTQNGILGYTVSNNSGGVGDGSGVDKFIDTAKSHIGTGGHDWVIKTAGIPRNLGWCAATMFAVAKECGYAGIIFPSESDGNRWSADPNNGFVPAIYNKYGGQKITGTPQKGDIFQRIGSPHNHVGLVVDVDANNGTMVTVEGNTGTKINGERQLKSNNKKISSVNFFARPNWSKVSSSESNKGSVSNTVQSSLSSSVDSAVSQIMNSRG